MLPLSSDYTNIFSQADRLTGGRIFLHLQAILEGWKHAGNETFQLQLPIDWGELDFAHIPIGVLSQVYESFSRVWDPQESKQTSVYYTPKNIARYLVDDAFEGVADKKNAKVLDPSCGAGIFLVLVFRKLVAARWEHDGKRPDTKTIQSILYNQLCGFDISESALRLAALSLYITAIELNGSPRPPMSLKFPKPLNGVVLHNHRRTEEQETKGFVLGCLREDIAKGYSSRFDIVVGNPPWSRLKGKDEEAKKQIRIQNSAFTKLIRQILRDRGLTDFERQYSNPDNNPDLPFLWSALRWVKPGGIVAMALPGRIFLKQTASGTSACNAILRGMEITGILNGSNLSDTDVWPGMSQPFMLFFARNRMPATSHCFHFVTPHFEKYLNDKGRIRIDYQSAEAVAVSDVIRDSWLLKTLAVGTSLDVELVRKLDELAWPTVESYWKTHGLYSGLGYNRSPDQPQLDATFMRDLPNFEVPSSDAFAVDVSLLQRFDRPTLHRPRCIELYSSPVLIVPESPGSSPTSPKSWIVNEPIVFSKSYYGFSAHDSEHPQLVVALLHLITHSELFSYYVLMTSSRMGAERRTFLKENLESFRFPIIDDLSVRRKQQVINLSRQLEAEGMKGLAEIDDFVFDLYGFDEYDRQVVKDTLGVSAPFQLARERANSGPTKADRKAFYSELQRLLNPSFSVTDETVLIEEVEIRKEDGYLPWHFFAVSATHRSKSITQEAQKGLILRIVEEANRSGCSKVVVQGEGSLLIGITGQYRYWTLSRARLCALDLLRHHLSVFPIERS